MGLREQFTECESEKTVSKTRHIKSNDVYQVFWKNFLDRVLAFVLIIILALPMIFIGLVVMITSKGPIFFRQVRYGKNSKRFWLYKFRTMSIEAPVLANSEFNNMGTYLTKVGKFLRMTSLDELPQLVNIIKGDMSFIGPRPLADTDYEVIQLRKSSGADQVLPGISGLAQVNGRNNISNQTKARFDAEYASNVSFINDIRILFKTFVNVFLRKNINKKG